MILKKHTNELLKNISEVGQNANDFTLTKLQHSAYGEVARIILKKSPLFFDVTPASNEDFDKFTISYTAFSPGFPIRSITGVKNILEVKDNLNEWLNNEVKPYQENESETDFWKIIQETPLKIESIDFTKDEPFKPEEIIQLQIGLEEIKTLLTQNFELNENQLKVTNARIDYLIDATKRLNKTDWKGIAISTIIAITYDFSFDENKRAMLFGLFNKLWAIVQHLPQISL